MANKKKLDSGRHYSAIKRARQTLKKTEYNNFVRSSVRTFMKRVRNAVAAKDKSEAEAALKEALPRIAKAAGKNILHKKTASRYASRLTKAVQSL